MPFSYTDRETKYKSASSARQELYAGDASGPQLRQVFDAYHLKPELYREFALAFGDVVLELEKEERLPSILVDRLRLPEKVATLIAHDLLELINTALQGKKKPQPAQSKPAEAAVAPPAPPKPTPEPTQPPAWSRTVSAPPQGAGQPPRDLPTTPELPSYKRPMTDIPRYVRDDPYREPPQ